MEIDASYSHKKMLIYPYDLLKNTYHIKSLVHIFSQLTRSNMFFFIHYNYDKTTHFKKSSMHRKISQNIILTQGIPIPLLFSLYLSLSLHMYSSNLCMNTCIKGLVSKNN